MRRSILLTLSVLFLIGCDEMRAPEEPTQNAEPQSLSKNSAQENRLLAGFAKKLALAANQSQFKTWLVQQLAESGQAEEIVTVQWLFGQNVGAARFVDAIQANAALVSLISTHAAGIDIYFPVEAHRQAMRQNPAQVFLIAYWDGYQDDQEERELTAWDRQGNEVTLTTAAVPSTPVLVITQCEHRGDHSVPEACGEDCGGGGGGGSNPVAVLKVVHFRLMDERESWPNGDPEIYVRVGYGNPGSEQWEETQFPDVNDVGYYWNYCKTVYDWPFWPGGDSKFEVWEDDAWGTFGDDLLDNVWYQEGPNVTTAYVSSLGSAYWYRGQTNQDSDHYSQVKAYGASCP